MAQAQVPGAADPLTALSHADWQVRRDAAQQLGGTTEPDRDVVEALITALDDVDSRVRRAGAEALGQIGAAAAPATAALIERLGDPDPEVILAATRALGSIGRRASRAARDVQPLLQSPDAQLRVNAADALGRMRRSTGDAVAELIRLMRHPDTQIRAAAADAVGRIGARADNAAGGIMALLADDDADVRHAAANALGGLGETVVPALITSLTRGNPVYLASVVEALDAIGPTAVPQLVAALEDAGQPLLTRQYAARALARIGTRADAVVEPLVARLTDDDPQVRIAVAEALGNLGARASRAAEPLISRIEDGSEESLVREYAIAAVARVAPSAPEVQDVLVAAVADSDPMIYEAAVGALIELGLRSETVADDETRTLVAELRGPDSARRLSAARTLGGLGPYARGAADDLIGVLAADDSSAELRAAAATALGQIGPSAEAAVPALIEALGNADQSLASAALVALRRIGPQTHSLPALMEALKGSDLGVRGSAATTIRNFALARLRGWQGLLSQSAAPVLRAWVSRHEALYGIGDVAAASGGTQGTPVVTDYFDVLGGRAAIRESVQLQGLEAPTLSSPNQLTIPIERLDRIEIESHPFERMLADSSSPPVALGLAELVPADRFFGYFADIAALTEFLNGGQEIFLRLESSFSVKSFDYAVGDRYLRRLGLDATSLTELHSSGSVRELALVTPDLFFLEGTDISAIIRAESASLAAVAYPLLMPSAGDDTAIAMRRLDGGDEVYGARRNDLIFVGTNRAELENILALHDDPRTSLGRSAEFRYMLAQLPAADATRAYLYLSDAFIRRLVSPELKIAQLRRMRVRADLDMLTAGAMLFKLDGHTAAPDKTRLAQLGYVPSAFVDRDYQIGADFIARSAQFGRSAALKSLLEVPVERVSESEADAYREYVQDYSRYWRQFFDPIAMRLDRFNDSSFELTTFILPLLDSALYDAVEAALTSADSGLKLRVPELTPAPVMTFSVNLSDDMRLSLVATLTRLIETFTSIDPAIFDAFNATVHVAVRDSSPIVAIGSGDILGALSEDLLQLEGFEPFLPILLSLLSQPASVLIELADPDQVLSALRDAVGRRGSDAEGELHQLQNQDAWIYTLKVFDIVEVHLRVAVEGDYLVVSNLPWSQPTAQTGVGEDALNGARLELDFTAISALLPALHTKAYRDYRNAAIDGLGYLYPLLISGLADSVTEAQAQHLALFGFQPLHPGPGEWQWANGELSSSTFGSSTRQSQPSYVEGDRDFGLFPMLDWLAVGMQLENTGLRTRIRWTLAGN